MAGRPANASTLGAPYNAAAFGFAQRIRPVSSVITTPIGAHNSAASKQAIEAPASAFRFVFIFGVSPQTASPRARPFKRSL